MKNIKIFILLIVFSLVLINCTKNHEKIILTMGLPQNPDEPRYGIELSQNGLYYCEEIMPSNGKYNFFYTKISQEHFINIKNGIIKIFAKINTKLPPVDQQVYELIIIDKNKKIKKKFDGTQFEEIRDLIELKKLPMKKIPYHDFPKELLETKLPKPPPPPIGFDSTLIEE